MREGFLAGFAGLSGKMLTLLLILTTLILFAVVAFVVLFVVVAIMLESI